MIEKEIFEGKEGEVTISRFEDLRDSDLSERNLKSVPIEVLMTTSFTTNTKWPVKENLPEGFDPIKLMEESKNPGLGIRELHKEGIDGRGIRIAIIDQTLSSSDGNLLSHAEYSPNIFDYKEYGDAKNEDTSMHGPAVASILVGGRCGVAPGAELVYKATPSGRSFEFWAKSLEDIIEENKSVDKNKKIRIVSCSFGYMINKPEPGLDKWVEAVRLASESGIILIDSGEPLGLDFIGGGAFSDKEDFESYNPWLNIKDSSMVNKDAIVVPSDYRTMACLLDGNEYMYEGKGGISWSIPYLAGLIALMLQVNPELQPEEIKDLINKTAVVNKSGLRIINPKGLIANAKVIL